MQLVPEGIPEGKQHEHLIIARDEFGAWSVVSHTSQEEAQAELIKNDGRPVVYLAVVVDKPVALQA